ncbi:MAG: hypothetical protein MJY67_03385 [Bacteroidales bacterium]|nr:hypothetical protein [Bacteroidales bacterium]
MSGYINLKKLSLEELTGVVNIYPWFSLARKELCERMSALGGWNQNQFSEAAMYMSDRKILSDLLRTVSTADYSDKNISEFLERCVTGKTEPDQPKEAPRVLVVNGDYFSQAEYEKVRQQDDNVFASYAGKASGVTSNTETQGEGEKFSFCTETLAQIYAEQGYFEQAKEIYSKLILAYPEKSVYFAALIEKLNIENQNL